MSDAWRKSSYSGSETNCVEVCNSRKSSYSGSQTNCVEVGNSVGVVKIRDTKDRQGPALAVSAGTWTKFLTDLK